MSTVTVTEEPTPEERPKADDAAFAAGQTVGRFESHMTQCDSRHCSSEMALSSIEARLAAVETASTAAMMQASSASVQAVTAEVVATEALVESAEEPEEEETDTVTELEMPEVDTPATEEEPKKKGFSLW